MFKYFWRQMKPKVVTAKKIGNHWYPNVNHDYPEDLALDEKIEKVLSIIDKFNYGIVSIYFFEQDEILYKGTLQFDEADMVKYLTTDDDLMISFYVDDHKFEISSTLMTLLEIQYNFDFQQNVYRVDFW
jgi:hypothetical protein